MKFISHLMSKFAIKSCINYLVTSSMNVSFLEFRRENNEIFVAGGTSHTRDNRSKGSESRRGVQRC